MYAVRTGPGYDLYVTDVTGAIAHKINQPLAWVYLASQWETPPSQIGVATVTGQTGTVWSYTLNSVTRYRFVPDNYSAALDAFYTAYSGGELSGFVTKRND